MAEVSSGPPLPVATDTADGPLHSLDHRLQFSQARDVLTGLTGCTPDVAASALRTVAADLAIDVADIGALFLRCLDAEDGWQAESLALDVVAAAADPDPDDRALARCADGSLAGLEALYDRHGRHCWSMARRMLNDDARAALTVEEVFLDLWREVAGGSVAPRPVDTYLLMLTHDKCADRLRDNRRQVVAPAAFAARCEPPPGCLADDDDVRTVMLAFWNGFTQRQVAELSDLSLATVKTRMRSGLLTLTRSRLASPNLATS